MVSLSGLGFIICKFGILNILIDICLQISSTIPDSGGAFKVTVHSPYIVLNRTGLDLDIRAEGSKLFGQSSGAAGQFALNENSEEVKGTPFMFSFPSENRKNRARLQVGDSDWSSPQSFDAIGSAYSVALKSTTGRTEMNVGVSVTEGEGKVSCSCNRSAGSC
jgi:vacuolar protein sorting-associated protein 13A/C